MTGLVDSFRRRINYMRISVTDRCDLGCIYCSDRAAPHVPHKEVLRYEEIHRIVQAAASLGVQKIRLTGGEPLVRADLARLVSLIAGTDGIDDISLTSNGTLLARHAAALKAAGLRRVNVSLDTLKPERYRRITGGGNLHDVLGGIEAARTAGLSPVKINMVVLRGINEDEVLDFAGKTLADGWHVRFIEHMPFTTSQGADAGGVLAVADIFRLVQAAYGPLEPHTPASGNGPARYYRPPGAGGTLGFIGAVTDCFCARCNRFRLTADGALRPCLLEDDEVDLKGPLRRGATTEELAALMLGAATLKREQHRLSEDVVPTNRRMQQIGG